MPFLLICAFICLFVYLFVCLLVHLFVCLFVLYDWHVDSRQAAQKDCMHTQKNQTCHRHRSIMDGDVCLFVCLFLHFKSSKTSKKSLFWHALRNEKLWFSACSLTHTHFYIFLTAMPDIKSITILRKILSLLKNNLEKKKYLALQSRKSWNNKQADTACTHVRI